MQIFIADCWNTSSYVKFISSMKISPWTLTTGRFCWFSLEHHAVKKKDESIRCLYLNGNGIILFVKFVLMSSMFKFMIIRLFNLSFIPLKFRKGRSSCVVANTSTTKSSFDSLFRMINSLRAELSENCEFDHWSWALYQWEVLIGIC